MVGSGHWLGRRNDVITATMKWKNAFLLSLALWTSGCHTKTTVYGGGCGARPAGWITPRQGHSIWNGVDTVTVAANGTLEFNGTSISKNNLRSNLQLVRGLEPAVIIHAKFDPEVNCETVSEIRHMMSEILDCQHGQCAEGEGHWWLIGDVGRNPQPYDPEAAPKSGKMPQ